MSNNGDVPNSVDNDSASFSTSEREAEVKENIESYFEDDECSVWTVNTESLLYSQVGSTASTSTEVKSGDQLPIAIDLQIDRRVFFKSLRKSLKPFELSTWQNCHLIKSMSDTDLSQSIVEIWRRTQLQKQGKRIEKPEWYNWVILDISRRMYDLLSRDNYQDLKPKLIESLSQAIYFQRFSEDLVQDGKPFSEYVLFDHGRVSRVVKIGTKFTDGICAFSDIIDFMFILNMSSKDFQDFYYRLLNSNNLLAERMKIYQRMFYSSNPLGPYRPKRYMV